MDATKTDSFLDTTGFSDMISTHKRGKARKLKDYIEYCVIGDADKNCVSVFIDNFVEKGIIGKESKWFGIKRTYPTKDKGKQVPQYYYYHVPANDVLIKKVRTNNFELPKPLDIFRKFIGAIISNPIMLLISVSNGF